MLTCNQTRPVEAVAIQIYAENIKQEVIPGHWIGMYKTICETHISFGDLM